MPRVREVVTRIETELLPALHIESVHPHEPVVVHQIPPPWEFVGAGNYTVVLAHPSSPDLVVKVYAPGRPGLKEEAEVYRRLGEHPAFSGCLAAGANYLVLKRLRGMTFYECLRQGVLIPEQAVREIDEALAYARRRGLHPHDVHAKNVIVHQGRGYVADISDFLEEEEDSKWADLKRAYYRFYRPLMARRPFPVPNQVLNLIRRGYRLTKRLLASSD